MDVTEIGQGRGLEQAAPRVIGHHSPARGRAEPRHQPPNVTAAEPAAEPDVLFDANGDGVVEHWSFAYGGDSFTNFAPPPSGAFGSDVVPPRRTAGPARGTPPPGRIGPADRSPAPAGTPVAMRHATHAYHADGGAIGSAANPAPVRAPAPDAAAPGPAPAPGRTPR